MPSCSAASSHDKSPIKSSPASSILSSLRSSPMKSIDADTVSEYDMNLRPVEMSISKRKSLWHSLPYRCLNLNNNHSNNNNNYNNNNNNNIANNNNNNNNNYKTKNKNLGYERTYFETTYEWPRRLEELLSQEPANTENQLKHSWNPDDRSLNIFIKPDDFLIIHRHPVAQSTDCIRGKVGYNRGLHYWEITWNQQQRGTHPIVGIATKEAPLHCPGYRILIGSNKHSWGWDIAKNTIIHNGVEKNLTFVNGVVERRKANTPSDFVVPDKFGMVLDMEEGTLGFVIDNKYTGIAFGGLKGKTLYPVVNTVWGHCEVHMRYIASLTPQPLSLLETSRKLIEKSVVDKSYTDIFTLPIPTLLKVLVVKNAPSHHSEAIQQEIIRQADLRNLIQRENEEEEERDQESKERDTSRKIYSSDDGYSEFTNMEYEDYTGSHYNNNTIF